MNGPGQGPGPHSLVIDRVMDRINDARLEKALAVCEGLFKDMVDQLNDLPTSADNTTRSFSPSQKINDKNTKRPTIAHSIFLSQLFLFANLSSRGIASLRKRIINEIDEKISKLASCMKRPTQDTALHYGGRKGVTRTQSVAPDEALPQASSSRPIVPSLIFIELRFRSSSTTPSPSTRLRAPASAATLAALAT
ncbi:hypothetical protein ACFX15_013813 [Malus domestica]